LTYKRGSHDSQGIKARASGILLCARAFIVSETGLVVKTSFFEELKIKVHSWVPPKGYKVIIFAFGSYVKETETKDSDLDLYFVLNDPLSKTERDLIIIDECPRWEKELSALIGIPVHLSFYHKSNQSLLNEVIESHVKIYDYREL
jgi:predicted nucleotidyltransferase